MPLIHGIPNPLNYYNMRRVSFACPHFKYISVSITNMEYITKIKSWITTNLDGRYYIGRELNLDNGGTLVYNIKIGFETESELLFFILAHPRLHK